MVKNTRTFKNEWIDQYRIRGSVIMTGKVADPQNYYPLMDVLMLSSVF